MTTYKNVLPTTYSSKATAKRGALRAGLTDFECEQNAEGRWVVIDCAELKGLFAVEDLTATCTDPETGDTLHAPGMPVVDMEANDVAAMIAEAKDSAPENEAGPDLSKELGARDKKGFRRCSVEPAGATARVHEICQAMFNKWQDEGSDPATKPRRKDYMAACTADGLAYYTARTQIQKFLKG